MTRSDLDGNALGSIVSLARERMGGDRSVYYAPEIPPHKEVAARRVHEEHLPESEPILVLYDATIFGGADEGFVITPERLCWRNFLESPRQIAWEDIDLAGIGADGSGVRVAGGRIAGVGSLAGRAAAVIRELAAHHETGGRDGPYRAAAGAPPEVGEGAIGRLVSITRRFVGEVDGMYYLPSIPRKKLDNVRLTHADHLPDEEPIAVLYDDTVFGSAAEGFVLTPSRLCWKNLAAPPAMMAWGAINPDLVVSDGNVVYVTGRALHVSTHPERSGPVAALLATIAREVRAHGTLGDA
ncbi:MAG: hypothetical protein QM820_51550 [Minicystis sp.]